MLLFPFCFLTCFLHFPCTKIRAGDDYSLEQASTYGQTDTVALLLEHKANTDAVNDDVLLSASRNGYKKDCRFTCTGKIKKIKLYEQGVLFCDKFSSKFSKCV
jgi:hypothetical protein